MSTHRKTRELTGKHVLFCLLGFFGVVFAVNGVLVKAAISTFGGVETSSSYKAGLMFEQEVARAGQQDELHWQVVGKLARDKAGEAVLDISARDAKGVPLTGHNRAGAACASGRRAARPCDCAGPHQRRSLSRRSAGAAWPVGADCRSLSRRGARIPFAQPCHVKVIFPLIPASGPARNGADLRKLWIPLTRE